LFVYKSFIFEHLKQYDYIIAGAGAAGLSLLARLIKSNQFGQKKILLIDKAPKKANDRTWCFWEKGEGFFEKLLHKQWPNLVFHSDKASIPLAIAPFHYKMLRSQDFYEYCFALIDLHPNVDVKYEAIEKIESTASSATVKTANATYTADYVFNSILFEQPNLKPNQYHLLQHFTGWFIQTNEPYFDPQIATFMDFRVDQNLGTTFVYVLPTSTTTALVEYTFFNEQVATTEQYENWLKNYIDQYLKIDNYKITETEFGVIPMTNYAFPKQNGRIVNIGTAGGQTKASSGFTFHFIQKQTEKIVAQLIAEGNPFVKESFFSKRFNLYDSTLLNVLHNKKKGGREIFHQIFAKVKHPSVLRFLHNESSFVEELKIMRSQPTGIFFKAAMQEIFR
jgi:lycopene beta-cyclase